MHIFACKMQKAAAVGLVSIFFNTGRWSEQTSVETRPLVTEYSPVMRCHRGAFKNGFMLPHIFIDVIKVPQRSGFTRKNVEKLTSLAYRLYLVQPCINGIPAVQYNLVSHVLNANFSVPPSHMLWKMESATVMLRLLSNPQLNKRGGHLQVETLRCLSLKAIHFPSFPPVDPIPLSCKREAKARVHKRYTSISASPSCCARLRVSSVCSNSWSFKPSVMKGCKIFEDIISKGQNVSRSKRWFLTDEYNKSSQQTRQIKGKSKYWYSG